MMKVLHIVEAFAGGIVTYLQTLINGLGDDYCSYILYALRPETPEDPEKLFKPGTVLIRSKHLTRNIDFKKDFLAFREVREITGQIQPDIVHLHSSKAGVIGRWALNGRKVPIFYTPHGYSFLMDCHPLKKSLYYLIEKATGFHAGMTIACGKREYEYGKRVSRQITYVNNSIDTTFLDSLNLETEKTGSPISVCTLARITQQKNPALFNQIAERFPEIHFVWIGDGELREQLTSKNIEITGWLSKEMALAKMTESAVFLLPSRWEGLPLSVLEAMYCKRFCIVSNVPGNTDAVCNGISGYVCNDLEEYARALKQVIEHKASEEMRNQARESVVQQFSQKSMIAQYKKIYRQTS